jgi:hypothetical protein
MKKLLLKKEEINLIISMYVNEKLSSVNISKKIGISKQLILKILKENNIDIRNSGRIYIGGRKIADKKWRENNEEYLKIKHKNWSEKNKEHLKEYHKKWREENLDKWREIKRNYEKKRKSTDPIYKLIGNFRTAIYTVLKENNVTKYGHYFDVLGYQPEQLVNHLEIQFKDGMTWDNYGKWHVDHKLPITHFKFNDVTDDEFKKCWSLENLQPMWGDENISKSNKI